MSKLSMHSVLATLLFSAVAASAHAEPAKKAPLFFCTPAAQIAPKIEYCEDNDAYINQGEDCLDKLDAEVKSSTAAMKAAFSPDATSQQTAKFKSTVQDYEQSSLTLAYLISLNQLAVKEMDDYVGALTLPEDADEPEITGGDPQAYAMKVSCYGETTKSLRSIQSDFRDRLQQLEKAKSMADANLSVSRNGGKGLDGDSIGANPVSGGVGKGSGVPAGQAPASPSDITGVKQDQQKQAQ